MIRKKLRKSNIKHLKVVYSPEEPLTSIEFPDDSVSSTDASEDQTTRSVPSSNAWVPAAAGLIAGGEVVKDLIKAADTMRIRPEDEATSEPARIARKRAENMQEESKRLKEDKTRGVK